MSEDGLSTVSGARMGELVSSFDWSTTPLGPMDRWPQGLKVAVGTCLGSRFPMFIWWGPQLINIYNDAYAPILGRKHPSGLGQPAPQLWRELWSEIEHDVNAVMREGRSTFYERRMMVVERNGFPEEAWFTWSHSPIPDGQGGVAGLLCVVTDVTEEREAEARTRTVLESITDAFFALDRGWRFTYANREAERVLGRTPGDLLGKVIWDEYPGLIGSEFEGLYRRAAGERVSGAVTSYYPDHERWYEVRAFPAGEGMSVYFRNVTERERSDVRDRFLLGLDDAVRPLSDPVEITATYAGMLAEHLGADRCAYADVEADEDTFNLTGDYNRPGVSSIVGRYRFTDFGAEVLRLMRADEPYVVADVDAHEPPVGDVAPYRATQIAAVICVPLHKAGRFVAAMAVHQRVPRRWRADEVVTVQRVAARCWESIERTRVERDLRRSEVQLRAIFEQSITGIAQLGLDGRIVMANESYCALLGYSAEELSGMTMQELTHPDDLALNLRLLSEAMGEPGGGQYVLEKRYVRRDGSAVWASVATKVLVDERGAPTAVLGVITDVTDRRRAERERDRLLEAERAARAEAERASRMKDEFLATLSHELRTPLNAILGWSQVLRGGGSTGAGVSADVVEGLEVIERNARAQTRIIEDLLEMSRIISGKVRLDVRLVAVPAVVEAAVETVRHASEAKGVRLRTVIDPHAGAVSGDAARLQQVFWNLLSNSVKHCGRGGQIEVRVARANGQAEVRVVDDGEGIEPSFLPHVFDRFRQADSSTTRRHGGLGLGLSIVKQLVELHGGTVTAASAGIGHGAAFTVTLPETTGPVPAAGEAGGGLPIAEVPADVADGFRMALNGLRVLVVDDEADARGLVERVLSQCGARVTMAGSVAEAMVAMARERPQVIVSDIGMPGEDGYALIAKVRDWAASFGAGTVPAVALTAYARSEDRTRALLAGFQSHLAKPVEPAELVATVASLAGRVR